MKRFNCTFKNVNGKMIVVLQQKSKLCLLISMNMERKVFYNYYFFSFPDPVKKVSVSVSNLKKSVGKCVNIFDCLHYYLNTNSSNKFAKISWSRLGKVILAFKIEIGGLLLCSIFSCLLKLVVFAMSQVSYHCNQQHCSVWFQCPGSGNPKLFASR